jgi:hypothetical protein
MLQRSIGAMRRTAKWAIRHALKLGHAVGPDWHSYPIADPRLGDGLPASIPVMRPKMSEWPRRGYRFPAGASF